jgi:hypothetical protein
MIKYDKIHFITLIILTAILDILRTSSYQTLLQLTIIRDRGKLRILELFKMDILCQIFKISIL